MRFHGYMRMTIKPAGYLFMGRLVERKRKWSNIFYYVSLIRIVFYIYRLRHKMIEQMRSLIKEKDSIIHNLTSKLQQLESGRDETFVHIHEYQNKYIKTTVGHLLAMGFVISNAMGEKGQRYLFFDVTDIPLDTTFLYHKDGKILPVDEVADKVVPTSFTSQIQTSVNYCDMLIQDLYKLQNKVEILSNEVQLLHKQKQKALASSSSQQKINVNLPFLKEDSSQSKKLYESGKIHNSIEIPMESIEQKIKEQDNPQRHQSQITPQQEDSSHIRVFSPPFLKNSHQMSLPYMPSNSRISERDKNSKSEIQIKKKASGRAMSFLEGQKYSLNSNEEEIYGLKNSQNRIGLCEQGHQQCPTPTRIPPHHEKKKEKIIYVRK